MYSNPPQTFFIFQHLRFSLWTGPGAEIPFASLSPSASKRTNSNFKPFLVGNWLQTWTILLLDIELVGNFWKSQTNSDIKKFMKYNQNIFKSYNEFEILKVVAQKLSPPCPLEFWTRNSRNSVNFEARRMFKVPKFSKKYLKFLIFYHFLLSLEGFLHNLQKRDIVFPVSPLMMVKTTSIRGNLGMQCQVFMNYEEVRPKNWKGMKRWEYFLLSFGTLTILLASKLIG